MSRPARKIVLIELRDAGVAGDQLANALGGRLAAVEFVQRILDSLRGGR